jgi:RNA polymerase primary sigma factor
MHHGTGWEPGLADYMRAIGMRRLLTAAQERELATAVQAGSDEARDALILSNLRLVVKVARGFRNRGMDLGDLVCEGNVGLIRAVEKFDPGVGCRFSTYAVWWIRQSIRRALERSHTVRIPSNMLQRAAAWKRAERALAAGQDRAPTRAEVHEQMDVSRLQARALGAALEVVEASCVSVDTERNGEELALRDAIPDERAADPGDAADRRAELERLAQLLPLMEERSRRILELRFGLGGREPLSLVAVGERFGLTRERVRQLEARALSRMAVAFRHGARALAPRKRCGERVGTAR